MTFCCRTNTHTCNCIDVRVKVDQVDQVSDVDKFWMKKLFGFTVLKPTERSVRPTL